VGKTERKEPLARAACRWNDNIKMYLIEKPWYFVD
jgi:hypothetical protein